MIRSELSEIMSQKPGKLLEKQRIALKNHIAGILERAAQHVRKCEYAEVRAMLADSPAGDGMGIDNKYINFAIPGHHEEPIDISQAIDQLESLDKATRLAGVW